MSKRKTGKGRAKQRGTTGRGSARDTTARTREWVGGRMLMTAYVGGEQPFRPELLLWLELPDDLVVGQAVVDPRDPAIDLGRSLLDAMQAPGIGPPRRPQRVRVASAALAAEVQAAAPGLEVVIAPTPELDRIFADMAEHLDAGGDEAPSYLDLGHAGAADLEILFHAAARLYPLAPWQIIDEQEALRVDIPALDVEAGCLTTFGRLGESIGFAVFPSLVAFERFLILSGTRLERGEEARPEGPFHSVLFLRGAELPDSMRREVAERGWPVAGPHAYPLATCCDSDGILKPLDAHDLQILETCAGALAAFCEQHRDRLAHRTGDADIDYGIHRDSARHAEPEPLTASFREASGIEVHLSLPYDAHAETLAAVQADPGAARDPITCARALHDLDRRLGDELFAFAGERWAAQLSACIEEIEGTDQGGQLYPHIALHDLSLIRERAGNKTIAQRYLAARKDRLSPPERAWLAAQQRAWLSIWAVTEVQPGHGLTLEDRLSGEVREVIDVSASRMLSVGHVLLGRVVDHAGLSVLCGSHPRSLPPRAAAEVERRIRTRSRRRRGPMAIGKLRERRLILFLYALWEDVAQASEERRSTLPELRNTDDEPLLLTIDQFAFEPAARDALGERLGAIDGFEEREPDGESRLFDVTRPGNRMHQSWENTLLGWARLDHDRLRLESNSIARADRLRERVEAACDGLLRHRGRAHEDPRARLQDTSAVTAAPAEAPPPKLIELIRAEKARHYATWPATSLPALGGKTPREAVRSAAGREQVDLLLRECEHHESLEPEDTRFHFGALRRELGLER